LIANASARLTLERIVEITTHVCKGLQAAHQRGLVHRDLKPSNIFVMDDDTAKIIDFGVVHLAGSKSVTGQKGTFQYMSPEQAQLKEITPASDIFSLGIILYEALTRRKPFARKTAEETMEAVIKLMPPPVSELYPSINQQVSKVVHKCLAKQPIHRFTSARELAETLQKAARNEPVFDSSKIEPRIERAKAAFKSGDEAFASEILGELESEGNLDPRITVLRMQIDVTVKQKKIRQLLESARARMEQDEIPLALDKIREVLELDPQNPDALAMRKAMEKQRSEAQIAKWLELAQTHLGNRDFGAARNAAQEVLAIRSADTRALDLLDKIESTEADAKRVRDQKEQLYSSAMQAYQNGEIDSALSKLERLFSVARANPNAAIPERDAVYQSFYKEVRSEREAIRSAFEDAQRQFSEKNFAGALTVCQELLSRYPNDGTIQALKIRIEDAERQELSSYIAEVSKRLEAEPDLDRRVNILREASERYSNETQFAQQLKLTRERRDLVNAIVTKARQYEERGQYAEAISQWDILRNIHPQYSGIAFEQEQCKKKRDRQAKEEEHSRLIEEIDGLMERRAYAKAVECAEAALFDFPNDAELAGLRTLAEQGIERSKESRRLFEQGQQALADQDLARATELLRSSLNLDPRAPGLREAVVTALTERARALVEQENWRDAEPLYQEANDLDGTHAAVRALRSSITEGKRQVFVGQCLSECRALVAAGKPQEAAERIRGARAQYPNDSRLEQYESSLQKEVKEARVAEERVRDRAALGENRRLAEQNADGMNWRDLLERSYAIKARHLDDPEFVQTVADIELSVKRAAKIDDLSQLLSLESVRSGTDGRPVVVSKQSSLQASPVADRKGPKLVDSGDRTKVFEIPEPQPKADLLEDTLRQAQAGLYKAWSLAKEMAEKSLVLIRPAKELSSVTLLIIATAVVLLGASAYVMVRRSTRVTPPPPLPQFVQITTDPADSTITCDGKPIANGSAAIGTTIEVRHLGYKTRQVQLQQDADGRVALTPEAVRLSIHTSEPAGSVAVDDQKIGDLAEGALDEYELPADGKTHQLSVTARGKKLFSVAVEVPAGGQPRVTSLDAPDLFAVSSLGTQATWYAGSQLANPRFGDQSVAVNPSGVSLKLSDQVHELYYGNGSDQGSFAVEISNAPALALQSLNAEGQVQITSNVEHGVLTVDAVPVQVGKNGWTVRRPPGVHKFVLSADGYETRSVSISMQRRQTFGRKIDLLAIAVEPLKAGLEITGGTPGANVAVDGTRVGGLDSAGDLRVENVLPVGKHTVVFSKSGYETLSEPVSVSVPAAGRAPTDAVIAKPILSASAVAVTFESNARDVAIKYRRVGETQFQTASAGERLMLAPGQYDVSAEAGGYMPYSTTTDVGKETSVIAVNLAPGPGYEFQDLSQVEKSGDWFKAKSSGKPVYLKTGLLNVTLVFFRAGKGWGGLKDKKVEWLIEDPTQHTRIQYTLEDQSGKLTRKLISGDDISDEIEKKVDAVTVNQQTSVSVHVRTEAGHISITNDKGQTLDDFTVPAQDFSKAKVGIRSDSLFLVRKD